MRAGGSVPGERLARVGGVAGLVLSLALTARLIQVQIRPGRAGLAFALVGGLLLVTPFAASLAVRGRVGGRGRRATWLGSGLLAMALGFLSPASFPLILCGVLLVAGAMSSRTHPEGAAA
jgi:hypothetical protein